jgi:hypothetical protein
LTRVTSFDEGSAGIIKSFNKLDTKNIKNMHLKIFAIKYVLEKLPTKIEKIMGMRAIQQHLELVRDCKMLKTLHLSFYSDQPGIEIDEYLPDSITDLICTGFVGCVVEKWPKD